MAILNKKQILAAQDLKTETVFVPEWGGEVIVRGLTGAERDAFEMQMMELKESGGYANMTDVRARLVALATVDEKGEPLFTFEDVKQLTQKSAVPLGRVFMAAQRLSGLTEADVKQIADSLKKDLSDVSTSN